MKTHAYLIFFSLNFSCGGNPSETPKAENVLENLTINVDTVVVNPDGEVIDLSWGINSNNSTISSDDRTLFHLDWRKAVVNEVDIDKLELTAIHPFSQNGPDGIGSDFSSIQSLEKEHFLIASRSNAGIFTKQGKKTTGLKFNFREIDGLDVFEEGLISNNLLLSADEKYLFSLTNNMPSSHEVYLYLIKPEDKTGKNIHLPAMNQALKSTIWMINGNVGTMHLEVIYAQHLGGKIYIGSSVTSDIYRYDYQKDSLRLFDFPHLLVTPRKSGDVQTQTSDEKQFEQEQAKLLYQTGFGKLVWDNQRRQFFRFATKPIPDEERKWYDRADVYLFVYDADLVLLGEKHLPELSKAPEFPFFKDGKLWSYINVEDELGFAVMDFKF